MGVLVMQAGISRESEVAASAPKGPDLFNDSSGGYGALALAVANHAESLNIKARVSLFDAPCYCQP